VPEAWNVGDPPVLRSVLQSHCASLEAERDALRPGRGALGALSIGRSQEPIGGGRTGWPQTPLRQRPSQPGAAGTQQHHQNHPCVVEPAKATQSTRFREARSKGAGIRQQIADGGV